MRRARPAASCWASLGSRRGEDSQTMSVGVERNESVPEVQVDRSLHHRQAPGLPFAMLGAHGLGVGNRERELATAELSWSARLDRVFRPQAEHHPGVQCEERKGGTGFDWRVSEQIGVEGGAGVRAVDVEQDEVGIEHGYSLPPTSAKFCQ